MLSPPPEDPENSTLSKIEHLRKLIGQLSDEGLEAR